MKRRAIPAKVREKLIEANAGICPVCGEEADKWEIDHIIPLALGGEDLPGNLESKCYRCHRLKTTGDVKQIAKVRRLEEKRLGTKRKRWKRKIGGKAVYE